MLIATDRHRENGQPFWLEISRHEAALHYLTEPPRGVHPELCVSGMLCIPTSDVDALAEEFSDWVYVAWGPETMY